MAEKPKKKQSEKKGSPATTVESYRNKIVTFLKAYEKKSMPLSELESKCTYANGSANMQDIAVSMR